jgi:hypothetical protein
MAAITYKEFGGGLDRRLPISVQDANRLWVLKNAYITAGKKIAKRPGLRLLPGALTGSVGLSAMGGGLQVFVTTGSAYVPPADVGVLYLDSYTLGGLTSLVGVRYAEIFQGYPYVVGVHRTSAPRPDPPPGQVAIPGLLVQDIPRHHYLDGAATIIADANCPHGDSATKLAGRVFTIGDEVVRFCAVGDARDWTTASDAGFLSVSLQQDTKSDPTAVGAFEDTLVVFFADGSQVWDIAVDPAANAIRRRMYGVGTEHPQSLATFYRDLVFASPFGVRSMSVQESVDRFDETDVGVPVDTLVAPAQVAHEAASLQPVLGAWIPQFGQYWLVYEVSGASKVFAYSFSRSSKLACWSVYDFPVVITGMTALAGRVYVRSADALYELDATQYTDAGTTIDVDVQMAFQDAKSPGIEKMFWGADYVFSGSATISYLYDPRDVGKETTPQSVTGDSRAGTVVPVEVSAAAIAPRFQHSADEAFTLDLASLYFHPLTVQTG